MTDKKGIVNVTEKRYKKLLEEIKAGPVRKSLLFEIVEQDGHKLLFSMKDTIGKWYPAVGEEGQKGYVQVLKGKAISYLTSEEVAVLASNRWVI